MHYPKNNTSFIQAKQWLAQRLPFVLYRLPQASNVKGIYQHDDTLELLENWAQSGFVFAPFDAKEQSVLLRPDTVETYPWVRTTAVKAQGAPIANAGKQEHLLLVQKSIAEIARGKLGKVVVSRQIKAPAVQDALGTFEALLNSYTDALVYCFHHPKIGTWMGATPERLLEVEDNRLFTTSLAGTLPIVGNDTTPQWSAKEIEEQHVVTAFIETCLLKHVKQLQISKPSSVKSGKVWHLKTEIEAELNAFEEVGPIVKALHPTPAVCGTPKEAARAFILKEEHYNREYYTGFLGELNLGQPNSLQLYVNLRCMKLTAASTSVYVGGGITKDSDPEKEWVETQHKSRTMLDVL